jgi:hypothetical protein
LKDWNFIEDKEKINIPQSDLQELKIQLIKDGEFFDENNIIDYSMLVGYYDLTREPMIGSSEMSIRSNNPDSFKVISLHYHLGHGLGLHVK